MNRGQTILLGTAIQIIGALTLFLKWGSITYEDARGQVTVSYTGISFLTSGDFGMCVGISTPLLICIAFAAMLLRFLVRIDRGYLVDVGVTAALIVIGSVYMMVWIGPGDYLYPDHIETTGIGPGPVAALLIALFSVYIAYRIDGGDGILPFSSPGDTDPGTPQPPGDAACGLYCPSCGTRIPVSGDADAKYCPGCGRDLGPLLREEGRRSPPGEPPYLRGADRVIPSRDSPCRP